MCLYPKLIKNRKYTANKKNGGIIPAITDGRKEMVPVGCGKCMECMKQKARGWQVRLLEEVRENQEGKYVTLTFNTKSLIELSTGIHKLEGYERENEIAKIAVRRFLERWRKEHKKSLRHWLVTELGHEGTEHIHIHGLVFTKENKEKINETWQYGNTRIYDNTNEGYVNERTINYIVKYVSKQDLKHREYKPMILTSPGIGSGYLKREDSKNNKFNGKKTKETYRTRQGFKIALPTYYRNHIYTEEEREELWMQKLDEETRWVNGSKIDISKGDEQYYRQLYYERIRNKELGYGDDSVNWERKRYERERRNLIFKNRTEGPPAVEAPQFLKGEEKSPFEKFEGIRENIREDNTDWISEDENKKIMEKIGYLK